MPKMQARLNELCSILGEDSVLKTTKVEGSVGESGSDESFQIEDAPA